MTDGSWVDFKMNYVNIVDTAKPKTTIPKPTPKLIMEKFTIHLWLMETFRR